MTEPNPLRKRIAHAIHRYDNHHTLSGNDIPSKHHYGEADFVLAELRTELAALAEYENTINWMTTCTSCARVLDSSIRETERAERAEAALTHVRGACDQLRRAAVLADGQAHTDRERGILQAVDRITRALDEPAAGTTATQATDEPVPRKVLPPRDCLFGRDGARPCPTSDRCATCDPKEQPDA